MGLEENKERHITSWMAEKVKTSTESFCTHLNKRFNNLSIKSKKAGLLAFGALVGSICLALVVQALKSDQDHKEFTIEKITIPNDIYMNEEERTIHEDQLIPVGKLKGEIEGEFEAFYLAVDKDGQTYINRSLEFSVDAYHKSRGWEQVSKQELSRYEKYLHFIPLKSRGLKH